MTTRSWKDDLPLYVALLAVATLGGAYAFEYFGKLAPCPLCLQQRIPYFMAIPAALIAAVLTFRNPGNRTTPLLMLACTVAFVVGAGLAGYHAGVEYGWWPGPDSCSATSDIDRLSREALDALMKGLTDTTVVRCDQAPWTLLGISLAGFNFLLSLLLAGLSGLSYIRTMAHRN